MRPVLPLLCLVATACGAFAGTDKSEDHPADTSSTGGDSGVLAEARIPGTDSGPGTSSSPCGQKHFYCNDFEQQSLTSHFSGSPVYEPADGGVPAATLVPRETGGQAGRFSLGPLPSNERAKNWIGHFLRDAPAGTLRVSVDVKIAPSTDWPVNAGLPFFVVSVPTQANDAGNVSLSGLLTIGIDGSGKPTLYRSYDDGTGGASLSTASSASIELGKWFHVEIAVDAQVSLTVVRADGESSTISAKHDFTMNGMSPSIILGPAHYPGQEIPAVDVLYDNVTVDVQ